MSTMFQKPRLGNCAVDLWPFQEEAITAARQEFARINPTTGKPIKRTIFHLFTGAGKTIVAFAIARMAIQKGNRVLFLAAADELCSQAIKKADFFGIEACLEKASSRARSLFEPDCVVGSVATMRGKRLTSWDPDYFDLIFIDECHHVVAESYIKILKHFKKARVIGLTATVDRGDGEDILQVFESVSFVRDLAFAWNAPPPGPYASDIVPVKRDLGIDLRDLRRKAEDFTDADLEARITPHIEMLANLMKLESKDRSTLIFTPQVKSAEGMATALQALGVRAEWSAGDDPHRKSKVDRYQAGDLQMLCACHLYCEGFDAPRTSSLGLLRPTKSRNLLAQMVGRGVRLFPGKTDCYAVDPGFMVGDQHELVTLSELCDSPGMDGEVTDIMDELMTKDKQLTLKMAMAKAEGVHKEREILRIKAKEREIRARRVSYSMRDVYNTMGVPWREPRNPMIIKDPLTDKQRAFLEGRGIQDVESMSKTKATTLIGILLARQKANLATHKQVAVLIKNDIDPAIARAMSFDEAHEKLDELIGGRRG